MNQEEKNMAAIQLIDFGFKCAIANNKLEELKKALDRQSEEHTKSVINILKGLTKIK